MHETMLVADLVREASRVAAESGDAEAHSVSIEIGALNRATPASLRNLLMDAALGTVLEGATFTIEKSRDS